MSKTKSVQSRDGCPCRRETWTGSKFDLRLPSPPRKRVVLKFPNIRTLVPTDLTVWSGAFSHDAMFCCCCFWYSKSSLLRGVKASSRFSKYKPFGASRDAFWFWLGMDALSLGLTVFIEGPDFVKKFLLLCITFGSSNYNSFSAVIMDLVAVIRFRMASNSRWKAKYFLPPLAMPMRTTSWSFVPQSRTL